MLLTDFEIRFLSLLSSDHQSMQTIRDGMAFHGWRPSEAMIVGTLRKLMEHALVAAYRYDSRGRKYVLLEEDSKLDPTCMWFFATEAGRTQVAVSRRLV